MRGFKYAVFVCVFAIAKIGNAQQNFTLYSMPSIPQSNLLNPAQMPDCKWHVGIPALNSFYFQYANSGFNLNNIFNAMDRVNNDTSVLNLNKVLDIMDKKNYISFRVQQSWLSGGFKLLKKHYFHISVQEKINVGFSIPKDLFRFAIDGNGGANLGQTFDFDFKVSAVHYREYAIGYAYNLMDKLTVGGRLKYLQGLNIAETKSAVVSLTTNPQDFSYDVRSKIELNTASSLGSLNVTDSNNNFKPDARNFFRTKNKGMGLDLGAQYQFSDRISFSASLLDLGFITWKQNTWNVFSENPNAVYHFDGIHFNSGDTSVSDPGQLATNTVDTLKKVFHLKTGSYQFTRSLSTEFFLGANYTISKRLKTGALFYGDFFNRRFYPGLTLNLNYKLGKALSFNFTNTIYNRSWINPGLGVSVNAGAFQMYSVMDNFLFPVMISSLRTFSWRFGSNIAIGRKRLNPKKSKAQDTGGDPAGTDPSRL